MKRVETDEPIEPKGFSIDELRYRRAFSLAKYEMVKYQTMEEMKRFGSGFTTGRGIMGKLLGSLNYIDYAVLAFQVGKRIFKWRKKK
ncbi:MAG: hypothetical protein HDS53_07000 [Barnesiella sp.]|nr:hypothetical protein [Barnesiella sp.]